MDPIITLGGEFVTSTMGYIGQLWQDLETFIVVLIGLPVGFYVLSKVIGLFRGGLRGRRV